jgi:hypothetical protein
VQFVASQRGMSEISAEFQENSDKPTKKDTQAICILRFAQHIVTPLALHISLYYNVLYWQGWRVCFLVANLKNRRLAPLLPVKWIGTADISGNTQSWIVIRDRLETLDISLCHSNRVSCLNSPQFTTVNAFCIQHPNPWAIYVMVPVKSN